MHSKSLLDCLQLAGLLFQQMLRWLKSPARQDLHALESEKWFSCLDTLLCGWLKSLQMFVESGTAFLTDPFSALMAYILQFSWELRHCISNALWSIFILCWYCQEYRLQVYRLQELTANKNYTGQVLFEISQDVSYKGIISKHLS